MMVVGGTSKTSLVVVRPTEDDASTRDAVAAELRAEHQRPEFLLSATSAVTYSCQITAPFGATFVSENVTAILGYTAG
ncbi:MAG TPA: hypothetical protein VF316_19265, partial [Polyangiaceae bacterium]